MEKIHANMGFDVVFLYENIRTCLFACNFLCFHSPLWVMVSCPDSLGMRSSNILMLLGKIKVHACTCTLSQES